jgi:hypothetical protein
MPRASRRCRESWVGEYFQQSGGGKKRWVVPVELSEIKAEGDKVSGVVSKYQTPNGGCVASNTPFSGTYQDGVLSIKSKPMTSQKADGSNCGGIEVHVKLTGGHAVGTFGQGSDKGIQIEFDAK